MNRDDIFDVIAEIEARHKETGEGFSYKDSEKLKKVEERLNSENVCDLCGDKLADFAYLYAYLGKAYERMGRIACAKKNYEKSVECYARLFDEKGSAENGFSVALSQCVKCRNYFEDDDCSDLKIIAEKCFDKNFSFDELLSHRRSLNHDPIEKTEKYLSVIDEVDEKVSKNRTIYGPGACHEMWHLKARFLAEKGIEWHSPVVLNPGVRFD